MSINFNIENTSDIIYKINDFAPYGLGKYHLYKNNYTQKIDNNNYGLGYSTFQSNPIVANKTILYGDNYYESLEFEEPIVYTDMGTSGLDVYVDRHYFVYLSDEVLFACDGRYYLNNTYTDFTLYHGEELYWDEVSDIDKSAGLLFKTGDINELSIANVHSSVMRFYEFRDLWDIQYRLAHQTLLNYLSLNYRNSGLYYNGSRNYGFKFYYISTSGDIKEFPARSIRRDFSSFGVLAYSGARVIIPFISGDEYNAAYAATYKWNSQTIQQIDEYLNN